MKTNPAEVAMTSMHRYASMMSDMSEREAKGVRNFECQGTHILAFMLGMSVMYGSTTQAFRDSIDGFFEEVRRAQGENVTSLHLKKAGVL
jgi:hypothetical protein